MEWRNGAAGTAISSLDAREKSVTRASHVELTSIGSQLIGQLGFRELRRRIWHMSPGFLPFILWAIPHRDPISPTLQSVITAIIVLLAVRIFWGFRTIRRRNEGEHTGTAAVIGYSLSVLGCLLLFPAQAEISLAVLGILAFGDGSATLIGLLWGGRKLPWNAEKSWSGFLSFIVIGSLMSALIYWGESHNLEAQTPGVSFALALACTTLATIPAAIAESLNVRLNDNIRVGVTAAIALAAAHGWLVGWAG